MNQYEVMYVIDTALEEPVRQETIARFAALVEQNGGTIDRIDEWGKRRLAYSINYKTEGYYVLMYVTAPPALPRELERNLQIADSVLRYLVIRFEGALPPKREPLKPFVPAQHAASAVSAPVAESAPAATDEAPAEVVQATQVVEVVASEQPAEEEITAVADAVAEV